MKYVWRLARVLALFAVSANTCAIVSANDSAPIDGPDNSAQRASVALKLYSPPRLSSKWLGQGATVYAAALCVASSTGRYRLHVANIEGASTDAIGSLTYLVEFRDASGRVQQERLSGVDAVVFEGSGAKSTECIAGANSSLSIRIPELDLAGHVSGEYLDNIQLSADPI